MNGTAPQTALITGATSGIGFELAKVFAHEGYQVVLVAREEGKLLPRAESLTLTSGMTVTVIGADLSLPTGPIAVYRELQSHRIPVHVLVNNAGVGVHGSFAATDWQDELGLVALNVLALTRLTKLFLPEMLTRGEGKILNVASAAALQPGPLMAVYAATKAYVLSFSQALRQELRGSGVTVTTLCPGPTRTNFYARAKARHVRSSQGHLADPAAVARAGYRGLQRDRAVVIPGLGNKIGAGLARFLPQLLVVKYVRWRHES